MKTVKDVSKIAGISIRTLQYYDKIGLLIPSNHTEAGYRLYGEDDMKKLQQILLFRELKFPLKDIKNIMESDNFDRDVALKQQIELLIMKKQHIENLILFAKGIKELGVDYMNFEVFDTSKIDEYAENAKELWGNTYEFKEFEMKQKNRSDEETKMINQQLMMIFSEFGKIKDENFNSPKVQSLVKKLQDFITNHYYKCSDEMLGKLGEMYVFGSDFTKNIDNFGGEGTAKFVNMAIDYYCHHNK